MTPVREGGGSSSPPLTAFSSSGASVCCTSFFSRSSFFIDPPVSELSLILRWLEAPVKYLGGTNLTPVASPSASPQPPPASLPGFPTRPGSPPPPRWRAGVGRPRSSDACRRREGNGEGRRGPRTPRGPGWRGRARVSPARTGRSLPFPRHCGTSGSASVVLQVEALAKGRGIPPVLGSDRSLLHPIERARGGDPDRLSVQLDPNRLQVLELEGFPQPSENVELKRAFGWGVLHGGVVTQK